MAHLNKTTLKFVALLVGFLGPLLVRLLMSTLRIKVIGAENHEEGRKGGQNVIFACWHETQLLFAYTHRGQGIRVLVSQHGDGELIARILQGLGWGPVRGSTTRGGSAALRRMLREVREGHDLAITPDGPKGPRHRVQPGVITLARLTGAPILYAYWSANRMWEFGSWDRFRVPWPFSRVVVFMDGPLWVPRSLSPEGEEEYRLRLEKELQEESGRAEAYFGSV